MLKLSNDCQSEYKLLKSNYDNIDSIIDDENKLHFYAGIPTVAIFDLVFDFFENSINESDTSNLKKKKKTFIMVLMRLQLGLLEQDPCI